MSTSTIQKCRRCGQCCSKGGPALHLEDLECFGGRGGLGMEHLVTLRAGELVHDQPTGKIQRLDLELVKIRNAESGNACLFYLPEGKACGIYARRPAECRALECADPEPLKAMYERDRLTRKGLLPKGHPLLELLDAHDKRCSPELLGDLARKVMEGDERALQEVGSMLAYDDEIRLQVARRSGLSAEAMDFLFGRALGIVLLGFGLRAERTESGVRLSRNPFTRNTP